MSPTRTIPKPPNPRKLGLKQRLLQQSCRQNPGLLREETFFANLDQTADTIPFRVFCVRRDDYSCPLYRTNVRAGVLSTTGASTNYVLDIKFPTPPEHPPSFYILQGTAGLTMLND